MIVNSVKVTGLFERFDHHLSFNPGERIMIVISPNGFGKTMTLRLIDTLFNQPLMRLNTFSFGEVEVVFDDASQLVATRNPPNAPNRDERSPFAIRYTPNNSSQLAYSPRRSKISPGTLDFPLSIFEELVPSLTRIASRRWRDLDTGRELSLDDVLDQYADELPHIRQDISPPVPAWLREIRESTRSA